MLDFVFVSVLAVVFCLVAVYWMRAEAYPRYARIRDATTMENRDDRDGPVVFEGTATRNGGTVKPVLSDEALCAVSTIYEYKASLAQPRRSGWRYAAYRVRCGRFVARTDGGRCIVPSVREQRSSSTGAVGEVADESQMETGLPVATSLQSDSLLSKLPESPWRFDVDHFDHSLTVPYAERHDLSTDAETMERYFNIDLQRKPISTILPYIKRNATRRYDEFTIREGDEITVVGEVDHYVGGDPVLTNPEDGRLIVSTLSPTELEQHHRRLYYRQTYALPVLILSLLGLIWIVVLAFG